MHNCHSKINIAMILAAGLGTRMRPLTNDRPKPLIEVSGKALMDYTLDQLAAAGVNQTIINVHYLADQIEAHCANRTKPEIIISDERQQLLETGGGLLKAAPLLGSDAFYCCNTDAILQNTNGKNALTRLQEYFDPEKMDALLLLCPLKSASGYSGRGDFSLASGGDFGPLQWRDDSSGDAKLYIYTGYQILHPRLLHGPADTPFSAKRFWQEAMDKSRAYGLVHDGGWMHVGDPEGLKLAQQQLDDADTEQRQ
jgi:N-acetyl-alpha-D-muramate 1-phosphate uridylyltransferase